MAQRFTRLDRRLLLSYGGDILGGDSRGDDRSVAIPTRLIRVAGSGPGGPVGSAFGQHEVDRYIVRQHGDALHHLTLERQGQENGAGPGSEGTGSLGS